MLELTERVEPPPAETVGDLDVYTKAEPEPEARAAPPPPKPVAVAAGARRRAPGQRADRLRRRRRLRPALRRIAMPAGGRTLEDVVRELLRPLLKAWLDENLPRIVEAKVAEEVERIARSRVR